MPGNPSKIQLIVAKNIKKLRLSRNISQEELAFISGLNRTYIGCVERAEKNISINYLFKISEALKVNIAELVALDVD